MKNGRLIPIMVAIAVSAIFLHVTNEKINANNGKFEVEVQCHCKESVYKYNPCSDARLYTVRARNLVGAKSKARRQFRKDAKCKGIARRIQILSTTPLEEDLRYLKWDVTVNCAITIGEPNKTYTVTARTRGQASREARRRYKLDYSLCKIPAWPKVIRVKLKK